MSSVVGIRSVENPQNAPQFDCHSSAASGSQEQRVLRRTGCRWSIDPVHKRNVENLPRPPRGRHRRRRRRATRARAASLVFQFSARAEYRWLSSTRSLSRPLLYTQIPLSNRGWKGDERETSTPNHSHPPANPNETHPRGGALSSPRCRCYSYPLHDNDGNQTLRKDFRKFSRLFVGSRGGGGGGRHKHRSPRRPRTPGSHPFLSIPSIRFVTLSSTADTVIATYPNHLLFNDLTWNATRRLAW